MEGPFSFTHIPLAPFDNSIGTQRTSGSKDDRIVEGAQYLAKIHNKWYLGTFSEQWYGWSFNGWGYTGIQLDLIEDLYLFEVID